MRPRYYLDFWTAGSAALVGRRELGGATGRTACGALDSSGRSCAHSGPMVRRPVGPPGATWVEVTSSRRRQRRSAALGFGRTGRLVVHSG